MKAKVYIPIIIGAGAAAGIILGVVNFGSHRKENEQDQPVIAQETTTAETTLSEEEKKKLEEQKNKEYEEKKKKEEQNASEKLKKKDEEKQKKKEEEAKKKEEEEKKKAEEEKKKAEEEKKKEEEKASEEIEDGTYGSQTEESLASSDHNGGEADDDVEYEYIYVPVNNNSNSYGQQNTEQSSQTEPTTTQTQHVHTWDPVYITVHHNATTHNEKKKVGTTEYNECFYNGSPYFTLITEYEGSYFYQVCKLANGDLFHETSMESEKIDIDDVKRQMHISEEDEAYTFKDRIEEITNDVTVPDREAYDEKKFDHWVCTGCGQTY